MSGCLYFDKLSSLIIEIHFSLSVLNMCFLISYKFMILRNEMFNICDAQGNVKYCFYTTFTSQYFQISFFSLSGMFCFNTIS